MTLASRFAAVVSAIGADIKSLRLRLTNIESASGNSPISVINAATRLIHTQKIMAQMALRGQV